MPDLIQAHPSRRTRCRRTRARRFDSVALGVDVVVAWVVIAGMSVAALRPLLSRW